MMRKIIRINKEKCNGCGLCAQACHEGAILMVEGKAKLMRDDYCDGLGDCLPVCPTGAITFEERDAAAYDEEAVKQHLENKKNLSYSPGSGCPGLNSHVVEHKPNAPLVNSGNLESELKQWPVQIKLAPLKAPYFEEANLLIAADCTAYAFGDFHRRFIRNHVTLIGCPKLDDGEYSEKLTEIIKLNNIKSLTVVRMNVPCCSGIENAVKTALKNSRKMIPWQIIVISTDGTILE